jgi:(4-(4-[2-(gamma-L-glutamylamino)ethyl]phenoxymethyl)furan-2-yl)methanamine synthase
MKHAVIGWDIGGAHLKAALLNEQGDLLEVLQLPCKLWLGLDQLEIAVNNTLHAFKIEPSAASHAVTMTGELVDLFANRHEGVLAISALATKLLGKDTLFYAANSGFVALERVSALTPHIASTNWHASASALAMHVNDALFIDIGSTTTDIVAIQADKVKNAVLSDAARMADDSLVYTGVVRTPVMALTQKIPFEGRLVNVAAEYFATMADVYTLTGDLSQAENMTETADGADKSIEASTRRIARMIGWDAQDTSLSAWRNLAYAFKHVQLNHIKQAVLRQISLLGDCRGLTIVGAGAGDFLVYELAKQLGFRYQSIANLIAAKDEATRDMAVVCFPAFAVATLARQHA